MDFREIVRNKMRERKLTYHQLANMAGISCSAVGNWYQKDSFAMQLSTAIKVAKVLRIDIPINQLDHRERRNEINDEY